MKYRKLLIIATCALFLAVTAICGIAVFKVAEINVTVTEISGSNENVKIYTEENCENLKGKNLLFINTEKLKKELEKKSYIKVLNIKKNFPNKLIVSVVERKEQFAVVSDGKFVVLDGEFHVVSLKNENVNNIDGQKNIAIILNISDYSPENTVVGQVFFINDEKLNSAVSSNADKLFSMRGDLSEIKINIKRNGYYDRRLTLCFTEGVTISIDDSDILLKEKLDFAYNYYQNDIANKSIGEYNLSVNKSTGEFNII